MVEENNSQQELTWKCSNCGYTVKVQVPPDPCPNCGVSCEFLNVTCYIPDCGDAGSGNIDPRIK